MWWFVRVNLSEHCGGFNIYDGLFGFIVWGQGGGSNGYDGFLGLTVWMDTGGFNVCDGLF